MNQTRSIKNPDNIDIAFLIAVIIAWVAAIWLGLVEIAQEAVTNEEASHILLVPLIAGYIIWQRRDAFVQLSASSRWPGLIMMCGGIALSEYGYTSYYKAVEEFGYLIIGLGAIIVAVGWRALLPFWPAIVVMVFVIPVPGRIRAEIAIPLQAWTAEISESLLKTAGFNIHRAGSILYINDQPVGIAEACNGARMVYAVFLVCYAYAMTSSMKSWAKVSILFFSPLVAIACNVLRVIPTVLMYGFSSKDAAGIFHDLAGWGVIVIAFGAIHLLVMLGGWLGLPIQLPAKSLTSN